MRRLTAPTMIVALTVSLVLAVLAVASPAASASPSPADENQFVTLVNQARSAAGLPALTVDSELTAAARSWTEQMASAGQISHAPDITAGITQYWLKVGENVGTGPTVNAVMDAFRASPGHNANILDPEFTHIGVGVVWVGGSLYTTHRFMRLEPTPAPTNPPPSTTRPPGTTPLPTVTTTTAAPGTATTAPRPASIPLPVITPPGSATAPTTTTTTSTIPETTTTIPLPPPPVDADRVVRLIEAFDASTR